MAAIIGFIIWAAIVLASIGGYIVNIVKLVLASDFAILELVRLAGIFVPPVGVVMGFVG